jgi:hypothetical protein
VKAILNAEASPLLTLIALGLLFWLGLVAMAIWS